jgi:putative ATP-dependent endonuclease of the OLD family
LSPPLPRRWTSIFDELGISVCSVSGTNFTPYVKLLGPAGLAIPHVVITDRDRAPDGTPRARRRVEGLLEIVDEGTDFSDFDDADLFEAGEKEGFFVNSDTLETELFSTGLRGRMVRVLKEELPLRQAARDALDGWVAAPNTVDGERLIKVVERVGKGRFAQRIAGGATERCCPEYIRSALEHIRDAIA